MYPSLALSAALIAPAAPVPRDTVPSTFGPAPQVLALKADANGNVRVMGNIPMKVTVTNTYFVMENNKQVQKQIDQDIVTSQYFNKTLSDCNGKFMTAAGTPLTLSEANTRIKKGATVLVSSDGKPIAKTWLRAANPDTVVMVADGFSHSILQYGNDPLPMTPAPRLVMLGTDTKGKVVVPCTSHPTDANNGVFYTEMAIQNQAVLGKRLVRSYGYYNPQVTESTVNFKPLADAKFDAYDLTGKLVARSEVLKRLAAGGMVVVAGDNRMPDENYLRGFREDVLVLVGPELVIPVKPIDKTKKNAGKGDKMEQALPPALQDPVQPGVIIRGGLIGAAAVPAVPVAKVKVAAKEEKPVAKPVEKK